jgi:hypothetical protein
LPAAVEIRDRGLCSGNLTESPPILLRAHP